MHRLILHTQVAPQFGRHEQPALRIHLGVAAECVRHEPQIFRVLGFLPRLAQHPFVVTPHRNGVNSSNTAVESGDEHFALAEPGQVLLEVDGKFKAPLVIYTTIVDTPRGLNDDGLGHDFHSLVRLGPEKSTSGHLGWIVT